MYGHCKECGQIFGSNGYKDRDGKMIMFEPCEHEMARDEYKVTSFQEACGPTYVSGDALGLKLSKLRMEAEKENKKLWIQLIPIDLSSNPNEPKEVSRQHIRFSILPYQIADVVSLVFDDKTEMRLCHRYAVKEDVGEVGDYTDQYNSDDEEDERWT